MACKVSWTVHCDECNKAGPRAASSFTAERRAVKRGWLEVWFLYGNHHLCPECRKNPPEWWPTEEEATV